MWRRKLAVVVVVGAGALVAAACRFDTSVYVLPPEADAAVRDGPRGDAGVSDAPAPRDGVAGDGAPTDGGPAADAGADAAECPPPCTSCHEDGTCQIDCGAGECGSGVTCPPGRACRVDCVGAQACETGLVDCTQATSCEINCLGEDACDNGVRCGGSTCSVTCEGDAACEDLGVECNATTCTIVCDGPKACAKQVCCNGADCGDACTDGNGGCCSCSGC